MEIAVGASLFAKGNMDVNASQPKKFMSY